MKATARTQRRSAQQTGPGISLFPFLAVLICTMGVLVPLLFAITRTARLQAEAAALAKMAQQGTEIQTQCEDVRWRTEQLKRSRAQTESQLADARLELGHLEDHSRRLRDRLAQYEKTAADLDNLGNADQARLSQSRKELEQVRTQINATQQQLAQAHQAAAGRSRCYAVVPYEGSSQTRRRPIYLECREDAIVLQPEGIAMTESDFEGPLGPGNPLAAALRAAREYLLAQREFDPQVGEPYPLLLVRPEGISAYYAARAAMKSWGFDFGYELVDNDWKLAYPPPDPRLVDIIRPVVASARANQARLIAAAPREYDRRSQVAYRAAPGGGFVPEGGPSDDDQGYSAARPAGPVGRDGGGGRGAGGGGGSDNPYPGSAGIGTGQPTAGGVQSGTGGSTGAFGNAYRGGGGTAGDPSLSVTGGQNGAAAGVADGNAGGDGGLGPALVGNGAGAGTYPGNAAGRGGDTSPGGSQPGDAGGLGNPMRGNGGGAAAGNPYRPSAENAGAMGSQGAGSPGARPSQGAYGSGGSSALSACPNPVAKGDRVAGPDGYIAGQPPREQAAPSGPPPADAQPGYALRPGEWQPTPDPPPKKRDDKQDKDDDKRAGKYKKSLAEKRGVDWALRDAARGSVGVTRPIHVECYADRLVIESERGPAGNKLIPLGPRTASSIDPLISGVWEHMETWGMAGRGMYWRPLLEIYVAPDAERRFAELARMLQGSGLMVERK